MSVAPLALEIVDLEVRYPLRRSAMDILARRPQREVRAVDGVSLTIERAEVLALVGESGCGKSSLARAALRVQEPSSGTIKVDGIDITHIAKRALRPLRKHMQMIYQDPYDSLDPRFRVGRTIEEPLLVHAVGDNKAERGSRVHEALTDAGLTPPDLFLDRYPHELSGGQRQRVAIAASLVVEPSLLVADEPVSMLDVSVRVAILQLLDELRNKGLGILLITHDLSTAASFADRIAVMYLGRIVEAGPARRVVNQPLHPYTRALLSAVPDLDSIGTKRTILTGDPPSPVDLPTGCRFRSRCPVAQADCAAVDPELALGDKPDHWVACIHPHITLSAAASIEDPRGED